MSRLLLILLLGSIHLAAAPAFQGEKSFKQDDGTSFSAHLQGDEYLNWIETDVNDILLFNKKSNQYEHAIIKDDKLIPSGSKFVKSTHHKASSAYTKLDKKQLKVLWDKKRREAFKKRKKKYTQHQ